MLDLQLDCAQNSKYFYRSSPALRRIKYKNIDKYAREKHPETINYSFFLVDEHFCNLREIKYKFK